jgi:hypothetical protein
MLKWRSAVLFLLILATLTSVGHATRFEIAPQVNYVWTSRVGVYWDAKSGDFDLASSPSWGIAVDIDLHSEAQLELLYNRQDTKLEFYEYPTRIKNEIADVSLDYLQIGGLYRRPMDKLEPYFLFTLGATRYAFKTTSYGDLWKFSLIFGLGSKVWLSERVGLRFQGRVLMPMSWSGAGLWCGGGSGCGVGVGGTSLMPQFDLGVGLAIRLGQ